MALADYKTDKDLEQNGKWFTCRFGEEVKIARINNKEFQKLQKELTKPYKRILAVGGEIPDKRQDEIAIELYARTIVKGWKPETMPHPETGVPMEFTYENVKFALEYSEDFLNDIASFAKEMESFRTESNKDVAKNS